MSESKHEKKSGDDVLERNVEQLIARVHEPPRMNPEARARVLEQLQGEVRGRRPERASVLALPSLGRRPAWAAGAVLAVGLAAVAVTAVLRDGPAADPSAYDANGVEVVALADGSEMILNRGARAVVTGDRRVRVEAGDVLIDVVPGDRRFVVETAHGELRVLGTRFLVTTSGDETRAAVVRGRVEARSGGGSAVLHAGDEAVLRDGKAPTRRRAPRLSHLAGWARLAQRQEEKPAPGPARRGTLLARNANWQENEYPLPMRALTVDVHVENQIARVALDQTFFNSQNQQLEGVYHLALPADAAIYRQAMYVDGKRMESGVVERREARRIYEEIVYQARDPALLEWMAGNLYKVRIFPLPARTEKRIVFGYTQPLRRLYDDYRLEVPLPAIDGAVDRVDFKVRLAGCASCTVASTSHTVTSAVDGADLLVTYRGERVSLGDDLVLTVRDRQAAPRVVQARDDGGRYLMVRAQPLAGETRAAGEHVRKRWVVLHDTSASRQPLDRKAQAHLVDQLLRQLDEDDEVLVMAFDAGVRQHGAGFVRVDDVDRREVAAFLARESADGVGYTDLASALRAASAALAAAGDDAAPHVLYLGDGIVTAGERELERLRAAVEGAVTFVGVAVGERMDMRVLRELADVTGGMTAVMNPGDDLGWRAFDLVAALSTPRVVDLEVSLVDATGAPLTGAVYPSARQIADGEELSLVARIGDARPAAIELRGRRGSEAWQHRIDLPAARAGDAGYLPRLWAQAHIDELLSADAAEAKEEITALGMRHFLVTPFTSLLVLENDAMYREYKVSRDRTKRWADYALPDTIPVVHEPIGASTGAAANVPLDAMLVRTPTQALSGLGTYFDGHMGGEGDGFFVDATITAGMDLGSIGTGAGFGRDGGGQAQPVGGTATAVAAVGAASSADGDDGIAITTEVVSSRQLNGLDNSWEVQLGTRGFEDERRRSVSSGPARDLKRKRVRRRGNRLDAYRELTRDSGLALGRRGPALGGLVDTRFGASHRGRYYGWSAPHPVAYHYPGDVRLDDLTEHVPGLFADGYDVEMRARAGGPRGSIADDARAFVDRSRASVGAARFTADGVVLEVDRRGALRVERTLEVGLGEEVLFDGAWLYHLYPQLGLATRRGAREGATAVYDRWAPFLLPPADSLARWYDVTRPAPARLRLVPAGSDAADGAVELTADDDGRVRRIERVVGSERTTLLQVTWHDDRVVIAQSGRTTTLVREGGQALGGVDTSAWAVVDMPLRQPAYLATRLEGATGSARRAVERQLLASWAALGNVSQMISVATAMVAEAPLSRGELALVSRATRSMTAAQLDSFTGGVDKGDGVAAYLRATHEQRTRSRAASFDRVARRDDGYVGTLAAYRGLLAEVWDYDRNRARSVVDRVRALSKRKAAPAFLYIAAHSFSNRYGWQQYERAVELWDLTADAMTDPAWRTTARVEAARWMYNRAQYDAATERFEQVLAELPADAAVPPLDRMAQWAFRNSGRGEAGWRLFWGQWREEALRRGDTASLLALATSATLLGEQRDLDRVSARLIDVGTASPDDAIAVAQTLHQSGRGAQALTVLEPHLADSEPDLLSLASVIAEQQGRLADAAGYFERALAAYGDAPVPLSVARADYGRMLGLLGRLSQTSGGAERAGYLARAAALAARWRQVDPDNDVIDQTMARTLYAVGRSEDGWRYLTGAIERHPGEGAAYQAVAQVLEEEGQIDKALPLWRRAVELEPESPVWLMREANALYALGQRDAGHAIIDRIVAGEWHERFRATVYQAQRLKQQRK